MAPQRPPGEWADIHGTLGVVLPPIAALLAIGSGKLMQEQWPRSGELNHLVYRLHLLAWLVMAQALKHCPAAL